MRKDEDDIMNKLNSDKIEKLIINYFDYISQLQKKVRQLNHKKNQEQLILDSLQSDEKEFLDMLTSDCTGKGEYHSSIMLPVELKIQLEKGDNLSKEERENLEKKYNLTLEYAKKMEQRYNELRDTEDQRLIKIKKCKNNIKNYDIELKKAKKEYSINMSRIKKLDSKLNAIKKADSKELKLSSKDNK